MAGVLIVGVSFPAMADTTCYTGCSPPPGGITGTVPSPTPGVRVTQSPPATVPFTSQAVPSGGLPFTGADIEQSLVIAVVLVGGGFALVRIGRRRSRSPS
jgi:hypothetical protein